MDPTRLRADLVGPLRDAGVMVVSSPSGGYKLAASVADLRAFAQEVDRRVVPQLKRLGLMRKAVLGTTQGAVDILGEGQLHLAGAIEAVEAPA